MPRRSYTKREKLTAVLAADMTTTEAAATAAGIPRSTLMYWMEQPEFVTYRQKTREEMADDIRTVAVVALKNLLTALESGTMEPRDVTMAFGVLVDKSQLLAGQATGRVETRDLTDSLDDHERATLRDVIDRATAELAPSPAGADPVGAGAEVRE